MSNKFLGSASTKFLLGRNLFRNGSPLSHSSSTETKLEIFSDFSEELKGLLLEIDSFIDSSLKKNPFKPRTSSSRKFNSFKQSLDGLERAELRDFFSNTMLFRTYVSENDKKRVITFLNKDLTEEAEARIKGIHSNFRQILSNKNSLMGNGFGDEHGLVSFRAIATGTDSSCWKKTGVTSSGSQYRRSGIISVKSFSSSTISNAKIHSGSNAMINVDISKFFQSFNMEKIYSFSLVQKAMLHYSKFHPGLSVHRPNLDDSSFSEYALKKESIEKIVPFMAFPFSSNLNSDHIDSLARNILSFGIDDADDMFSSFAEEPSSLMLEILRFFTFQGTVPTGACYSPELTSFLFAPIDYKIYKILYMKIYDKLLEVCPWLEGQSISFFLQTAKAYNFKISATRYIDDITISTPNKRVMLLDMNLIKEIEQVLNPEGFYLNYGKTKITGRGNDKHVTGINVLKKGGFSVGSDYKFQVHNEAKDLFYRDLPDTLTGKLAYIFSVSHRQFYFAISKIRLPNHVLVEQGLEMFIESNGCDVQDEKSWKKHWLGRALVAYLQHKKTNMLPKEDALSE